MEATTATKRGGDHRSEGRGRLGPRSIPRELLQRYEKSGPRYTSYPTAPQFKADFDRAELLRRWGASAASSAGLSLYVHLPFCKSRCAYCGCYTITGADGGTMERYVEAILDNADWLLGALGQARPVGQLALGGGTPTHLPKELLARLVRGLSGRFDLASEGERAIEIDPRRVDEEYLDLLVELGFNRFSFGVQDLDPEIQRLIGRQTELSSLTALLEHLRSRGHEAINLDLIYGLPGQRAEAFEATIRKVIALRPSRVATFGYAHVPWVSPHQKALEVAGLLDPEARMELFGLAFDLFLDAGYRHVGMDHFALPEDELILALESRTLTRNFMGYTTRKGLDLVPLGASAIGAVAGTYVQNVKDLDEYLSTRGPERWARGYLMTAEDELRREIILDLLCNFHLDKRAVAERHGVDFDRHFALELGELERLAADGLVTLAADELEVTELGRFFVRNISMTFDAFLRREDQTTERYSKTI